MSADDADRESMRRQAAEWFVRRDRGLDPRGEREFARWLEADARHREFFDELDQTWDLLGAARDPEPAVLRAPAATRRPWVLAAAAIAAGVAILLAVRSVVKSLQAPAGAAAAFTEDASTAVGEQRRLALPDGSILQINTDSEVQVKLTAARREVRLTRGEVEFEVAPNPARPFVVHADGIDVHDVGTVFDVRLRPDAVDVLVTEGRVRIEDGGSEQSLVAGEQAVIPRAAASGARPEVAAVDTAAMGRALAWQNRQLVFESETLADIAAEFNRYNAHKLVIADPQLAAQRWGGTFPIDDYQSLVRTLQNEFGVTVEDRGDVTVLRSAK